MDCASLYAGMTTVNESFTMDWLAKEHRRFNVQGNAGCHLSFALIIAVAEGLSRPRDRRPLYRCEPQHGWAIAERLHRLSGATHLIRQGSLYPALHVSSGVAGSKRIGEPPTTTVAPSTT